MDYSNIIDSAPIRPSVDHQMQFALENPDGLAISDLNLLPGWNELIDEMFTLADWTNTRIIKIWIDKGVLRFKGDGGRIKMFSRHVNVIAQDSTLTCVVCGQRGNRRKQEDGWPVLCPMHYIQYANEFDGLSPDVG